MAGKKARVWYEADWYDREVRDQEWTQVDRHMHRMKALDVDNPKWIRVSEYAYSKVGANERMYCPAPGEIAEFLDMPSSNLSSKAIRPAMEKGLLAPGSTSRKLILPVGVNYGRR